MVHRDRIALDVGPLCEVTSSSESFTLQTLARDSSSARTNDGPQVMTDHMMVAHYDPVHGWSAPEIKPYGPLLIDPASSCLQYATNVFEGMKAYRDNNGKVTLFRPDMNMKRMNSSAKRIALPVAILLQNVKQYYAEP